VLEHLARHPQGLPITLIASELDIPLSACHRLLAGLQRRDYVRQARKQGDYVLTTKVVSLGLGFLSSAGIVDIAEPILERLAETSGELVRLSIVDEDRLTWVAKSQGTRQAGQRYDPDMGMDVQLSCTSSGPCLAHDHERRTRAGTGVAPGLRRAGATTAPRRPPPSRRCWASCTRRGCAATR
jgi:IclR family acetate operon transcriptional repressor